MFKRTRPQTGLGLAAAGLCLFASACVEPADDELDFDVAPRIGSNRLKENAGPNVPVVGATIDVDGLGIAKYRNRLEAHYNQATVSLKWEHLRQDPEVYAFADGDEAVDHAEGNGQSVRGHTLVWEVNLPSWMNQGLGTTGVRDEMLEHIDTVVSRYQGRVAHWDVVNEAIDAGGNFRPNLFHWAMGDGYVAEAFWAARAADPAAKLTYNDFGVEVPGLKQDGVLALVGDLKAAGVPIDEVGFQMHAHPYDWMNGRVSYDDLRDAISQFGALGVDVYITELDVLIDELPEPEFDRLKAQKYVYQNVAAACYAEPACLGVTTWGFTDAFTYAPAARPLPFDDNYSAKPAKNGLRNGLAGADPVSVNPYFDTACPLEDTLFCEPFESPTLYGLGRVIVGGGSADPDGSGYRGATSLRADAPSAAGTRRAYAERRVRPDIGEGDLWTRAYLYVPASAPNNFTAFALDETHAPYYGVSFGIHVDGRTFLRTGGPAPTRSYGPQFPRDEWVCFEMHIDIGNSGGADLFLDGASVGSISGRDTRFGSKYGTVKAGVIWSPSNGPGIEFFSDEVAVSRTRIGCD